MPNLQAIHGRIVDLRRHTNVHLLYGHRPIGPSDRYELWIKPDEGKERKFTVNTRTMPARREHEVSLIVSTHKVPQVVGLANWSTVDGVNYAHQRQCAGNAMTIRFGSQVRLAPGDRRRLALLIDRDPGQIKSFAQLQALMLQHRRRYRGASEESEFVRWLMDQEWNRLEPGSGYPDVQ